MAVLMSMPDESKVRVLPAAMLTAAMGSTIFRPLIEKVAPKVVAVFVSEVRSKIAISPLPGMAAPLQLPVDDQRPSSASPVQVRSAWAEVAAQSEAQTMREERESGAKAAIRERNLGFMDLGIFVGSVGFKWGTPNVRSTLNSETMPLLPR